MSGQAAENENYSPNKLNAEFANTFLTSAVNTLKVQCNYELTAGKPFLLEKDLENIPTFNILSSIGLTSTKFNGAATLGFDEGLFLAVMGNMLDEKFEKIDEEVSDGAGELLNIIFGQVKIELNKKGYQIERAIPTVHWGEKVNTHIKAKTATICVPFTGKDGTLHILVAIDT